MKHEKQVEIQNAAVQVVTRLMLGLSPALHGLLCECVCVCVTHLPVVGSESGSQSDARLSFLQAGGRVHAAGAVRAGVQREGSGLVVLQQKQIVLQPEL